jgi:RHS repeat-associated protein
MRGNLIHDGVYTYTYDTAGRMVQAESLTATLVYTYTSAALSASNGDGLLVTQGTSATVSTFTWDLALRLPQVLGTSDSLHLYGYGRIGVRQNDAWHYPLPDALGSARQWTDGTGSLDYAAGYTPFGVPMWQQGSAPAPWGYTGEHWDANVGLLYLRARWYDPTVGRFTQADRIVPNPLNSQAWNRYAYGLNNPLRYTDPSGYCADGQDEPTWPEKIADIAGHPLVDITLGIADYFGVKLLRWQYELAYDVVVQTVADADLNTCQAHRELRILVVLTEQEIIAGIAIAVGTKTAQGALALVAPSGSISLCGLSYIGGFVVGYGGIYYILSEGVVGPFNEKRLFPLLDKLPLCPTEE